MAKSTTSVRLPDELIEALDQRAAALGVTRSDLIIDAIEQALGVGSSWSTGFLEAIGTPRPDLEDTADEMMKAIREHRSHSDAPEL
jgi:metal-responsive CopG/Arc/MetJ family transcriptional regulator